MPSMFEQTLSIIIPAYNEAETLPAVLASCQQLKPLEIVVVANGCTDRTVSIAKGFGCQVMVEPQAVGNDLGRAIGALRASGQVLLFLDADFSISTEQLRQFLLPIYKGYADVVLNDFDWLFYQQKRPHTTTLWRQICNHLFGRADLHIDSILSVPHALTRQVLEKIGYYALGNPSLAQLKIIQQGWKIAHQQQMDVITPNRFRPEEHGFIGSKLSRSERRIIGDHVAAISHFLTHPRGNYSDGGRRRDLVQRIKAQQYRPLITERINQASSTLYHGKRLSVIIPVQNEARTIVEVIRQVRKIEPYEIIVVVNGSHDETYALATMEGVKTIWFKETLGNDVGRAIGAYYAQGEILLFLDGDFILTPQQIFPFAQAIAQGADLAFNDLNHYLTLKLPLNMVTAYKYAINTAVDRKDLGVSSLIAVPHALSRHALRQIEWTSLLSPVVAQMRALLDPSLTLVVSQRVDVDRLNRVRPKEHYAERGLPPAVERIIGDHLEGLYELILRKGPRGIFPDDGRLWNKLENFFKK